VPLGAVVPEITFLRFLKNIIVSILVSYEYNTRMGFFKSSRNIVVENWVHELLLDSVKNKFLAKRTDVPDLDALF